jgi:predicted O-linked N-acetylglucosamine transferase (SPINDLY family)
MTTDIFSAAMLSSMSRKLSMTELIRAAETLKQSGQTESVETLYATWIEHNQGNPLLYAILFNYSVILSDSGKLQPARESLERALSINPEFMPAYINLGRVYERQGNAGLALVQWSAVSAKLAALNGTNITYKTTGLNQSARVLESANQDETAEEMLRQSLEIDPSQRDVTQHYVALRQRLCKWPVVAPWERVSQEALMAGMSPLSAAAYTDDPLLHLAMAWNYNKRDVGTPAGAFKAWPKLATAKKPLKIGYLCSDFREHALGYLMTEVLGLHDRSKVEVFAYYCGPEAKDALHANFKTSADHWISVTGMDDATAAQRMVDDKIQILVDLNGYTREARVKLIAMRPAPIIVNWLGYPGTMGSPYHHYVIADDWIIPKSEEIYYSEKVLRLPCYQPSNRKRNVAPKTPTRAEAGLPEDAFVYCCFNGAHKITRPTFERWLMILKRVPGSVLWFLSSSEAANKRLKDYAAQHGVEPERVIFAEKLANPYHLARYVLADLFLDTTPYGAHTTASDALWMGIPVLTLSGRSFASRVCGSLVRSAGIPELCFTSAADYVNCAVVLGTQPAMLQPLRERLRTGRDQCTLFDMPLLVRSLEVLYGQMWEDYRKEKLPRPDLSNLDVCLEVGSQVNHDEIEVQTISDYSMWWAARLAERDKFRAIPRIGRLNDLMTSNHLAGC